MLPFTRDEFFAVFAAYNESTWPASVVAYILALGCLLAIATRRSYAPVSSLPCWPFSGSGQASPTTGCFFADQSSRHRFCSLFCIQGLLFAHLAGRSERQALRLPALHSILGCLLVGYAAILYPLIGQLLGHAYPHASVFGFTPCPLVIFSFGMLLLSGARPASPHLRAPQCHDPSLCSTARRRAGTATSASTR
jgi:hypothetical protein